LFDLKVNNEITTKLNIISYLNNLIHLLGITMLSLTYNFSNLGKRIDPNGHVHKICTIVDVAMASIDSPSRRGTKMQYHVQERKHRKNDIETCRKNIGIDFGKILKSW
jgi:hypothetical protein